ncbi:hypothetical protein ACFO3L_04825, partial [Enterococcus eurekensis]
MKKVKIYICLWGLVLLVYCLLSAEVIAFAWDDSEGTVVQTDSMESENKEPMNSSDIEKLSSAEEHSYKSEEVINSESAEFDLGSSADTEMEESFEWGQDVEEKETSKDSDRSILTEYNIYGTVITSNYQLFSDKELEYDISDQYDLINKTIHIKESIIIKNEERYYSIEDNQNWLGYIHEKDIQIASGNQGIHQDYGKYVSIKGTNDIWDGFAWKNSKSGLAYKNQTFQARGVYHHFNGSRY